MLERLIAQIVAGLFGPMTTWLQRATGERWRKFRSESWAMAFGSVHIVSVVEKDYLWKATLSYSYSVAGEYYSGFLTQEFAHESDVDTFVHRFPQGSKLFVRYQPNKPRVSLVRLSENAPAYGGL